MEKLVPVPQAARFSTNGITEETPAIWFHGIAAVPLRNSCSANAAVIVVLSAATAVAPSAAATPKPSQITRSSLRHALISRLTSAAHSAGHDTSLACAHGYSGDMVPLLTVTFGLNAVCA